MSKMLLLNLIRSSSILNTLFRYFRQYKNSLFPNCQIFQVQSGVNIWAVRKVCEAAVVSVSAVSIAVCRVALVRGRRRDNAPRTFLPCVQDKFSNGSNMTQISRTMHITQWPSLHHPTVPATQLSAWSPVEMFAKEELVENFCTAIIL